MMSPKAAGTLTASMAILALSIVGCGGMEGARTEGGEQWHGRIYPYSGDELATSNSVASATMTRTSPGTVRATVTLRGGLSQGSYPWHVHRGTCGSEGPILGNADEYDPLVPSANEGQANETATFDATLDPAGEYYINIHRSEEEMQTIVACGDLVRG